MDDGQIAQVIHNLVLNAVQAMPEGGTIEIRADREQVAEGFDPALEPGKYVVLTIRDQGVGIDVDRLKNIFDPYFTTKPDGSGLGLTVAYSIVDKHGGSIRVSSARGSGTTFRIHLPTAELEPVDSPPRAAVPRFHGGRILVMDDDECIRDLVTEMLEALDYESAVAPDGEDAVRQYEEARRNGEPFAAVILDLTVPGGLGGLETIRRLRAIDPDVRAIVSSGYSTDPVMSDCERHGFGVAVRKPFLLEDMGEALAAVIRGE
ncbi:MAG: response regulator [Phycisphaeraceae bacterium]|nr:response regulator [Phycisphaeraceae bacterium]